MARQCRDSGISPVADLAQTRLALSAIDRLVARGLLAISAFTPTDAAVILGLFEGGDRNIAVKGGELMARQRTGAGVAQAASPEAFARMVMERVADGTVCSCPLGQRLCLSGSGRGTSQQE